MRAARYSITIVAILVAGAGCELVNNEEDFVDLRNVTRIRYSAHVQPLLNRNCGSCHSGASPAAGLDVSSWNKLLVGSGFGEAVVPFDAERSRLVKMVTSLVGGPHPLELGADTLTTEETDFLKRWIEEGAKNDAGEAPYANATELLYVANQNDATVSIVDTEQNVVVRVVDLTSHGFSVNAKPHHTAVEPDGSFWYVSLIGANRVLKFDRENALVGQTEIETPGLLALHPADDLLYVGRSLSAVNPPPSIGKITRSDMSVEEIPVLFPRPHALVVDPSLDYVHTASLGQNQLMTVAKADDAVSFTPVAGPTHAFVQHAASSLSTLMFSSAQLSNTIVVFDISTPTNIRQIASLPVNADPWHPVFTRDSEHVYVGNNAVGTVTVIRVDPLVVEQVIVGEGLAQPHGSAVSRDGQYVYISNRNGDGTYTPRHDFGEIESNGTLVVIATATNEIVKVLEVGRLAAGIAVRP